MGKLGVLGLALCVACAAKNSVDRTDSTGNVGKDGGTITPPADAGPADAGPADAGPADAGPKFGGPGPWPIGNVTYGFNDGILETPVVGVTTDETQNLWVATNSALYVMKPGDTRFTRFDANSGGPVDPKTGIEHKLHLPGNEAAWCFDAQGLHAAFLSGSTACPAGAADSPGISEIVGGGPNEVFVGYFGHHDWNRADDGTWTDPWMHSGKLDHVKLNSDGTLNVVRMDMVSNNSPEFWHNKIVWKMVYDHFKNSHELYVGTDHGVDKISADKWKLPDGWDFNPPNHNPGTWFLGGTNQQVWMSDHLHPQACFHHVCVGEQYTQLLGDWRGLALDANGDLWVGGRWAAGKIRYAADNAIWYQTPRPDDHKEAITPAFGDGSCPFFCPPQEGDPVNISAMAVTKDGKVWATSGTIYNDPADVPYGISAYDGHTFTHYDPGQVGFAESHVRDMVALPDGRLVIAGLNSGLVFWNPNTGAHVSLRSGQGIPDDHVMRIELDTMVDPPALHVATNNGATVLRVLPQ